jgi:hypothetical protein
MRLAAAAIGAAGVAGTATPALAAPDDTVVLEFHFSPVSRLQIAIWLETVDGQHVRDIYVTQATGKLGIGNRGGIWNYLSSWRFPYAPRTGVLPIWAHRRGKTYPRIVYHDGDGFQDDSYGWHEGTSSAEPYFCVPLAPAVHEALPPDAMSCPSPQMFNSDKGRVAADGVSRYPPRTDLAAFDSKRDHPDILDYPGLNDLDEVTGATPPGGAPTFETVIVRREDLPDGEIVAFVEASLEDDENADWTFDRCDDHYPDPYLEDCEDPESDRFGVEWLGQPAIVWRVQFDPADAGFHGTSDFHGYADLDGATGTIHPVDDTISTEGGSGADRLGEFSAFGQTVRFGVHSSGWMEGGDGCQTQTLPPIEGMAIEATEFSRARVRAVLPAGVPVGTEVSRLVAYLQPSQVPVSGEALLMGQQREYRVCPEAGPGCELVARPGDEVEVEIDALFGDFTYQVGLAYEDRCTNASELSVGEVTTPAQEFQQIETLCFVATAAFGGQFVPQVAALRGLRDRVLRRFAAGRLAVATYEAYGPAFARAIARRPVVRAHARTLLTPIAAVSAVVTGTALR